jgi:hypothetical protein
MDKTHFKTKSSNSKPTDYNAKDWDSAIPNKEYFAELMRVSKNQIIWGGNYFVENLTNSSCWVVWEQVKNILMNCLEFLKDQIIWGGNYFEFTSKSKHFYYLG